jgi:putative PEP-CTERM system TPR-repeat lipoprotein
LREILDRDPRNIPAYLKLAQIALDNDDDNELLMLLSKATSAAPNDPAPRLALAKYQMQKGALNEAQSTIDEILMRFTDEPEGMALLGQLQFARAQAPRAIETFRSLATRHTNSAAAYVVLAKALDSVKDRFAAVDAARTAAELAPFSTEVHSVLVGLLIIGERKNEALTVAQEFSTAHPSAEADLLVADALISLKKTKEARAFLEKRLMAKPSRILAQRLSQIAMSDGDPMRARRLLSGWLAKNPHDFDIHLQYASLLFQTGDRAGARKEFEALLKQRPEDPAVLNNLGWIIQDENMARAISLLSLAAKVSPRSPNIIDTLGWLKFQSRDQEGALPLLQRAYNLGSDNGEIGYHLALALDATGKRAEAKSLLESLVARNQTFSDLNSTKQLLARW